MNTHKIIPALIILFLISSSCSNSEHPYCECMSEQANYLKEVRENNFKDIGDYKLSADCKKIGKNLTKADSIEISKCSSFATLKKELEQLSDHSNGVADDDHFGVLNKVELLNGKDEKTKIDLMLSEEVKDKFTKAEFLELLRKISSECKYKCANPRTYNPKSSFISLDDDGIISVSFDYFAKNSFGVEGDIYSIYSIEGDDLTSYKEELTY